MLGKVVHININNYQNLNSICGFFNRGLSKKTISDNLQVFQILTQLSNVMIIYFQDVVEEEGREGWYVTPINF